MNDREIETIIQQAEKQVGANTVFRAGLMGFVSTLLTPLVFVSGLGFFMASWVGISWLITAYLWSDSRKFKRDLMNSRAQALWQEIEQRGSLGNTSSLKERGLLKEIGRIYERDPQGKILPLPHAISLVLAWTAQQQRLHLITAHIEQLRATRTTLLEKQQLLRELGDENAALQRTLARLNEDIIALECNCDALRASCTRLEFLLIEVEATARRRELHREVGELTAAFSSVGLKETEPFVLSHEHLNIERQISREIETYLQLERETDAHLSDL